MSSSTERLLRPGSTTGTVLSLLALLLVSVLGLLLVTSGVVPRPTLSDRSIATFLLGGAIGAATTALSHRSPAARRLWSRFSIRFVVLAVVIAAVMVALRTGWLHRTTVLVSLLGFLPAAAATRTLLYLRTRGVE